MELSAKSKNTDFCIFEKGKGSHDPPFVLAKIQVVKKKNGKSNYVFNNEICKYLFFIFNGKYKAILCLCKSTDEILSIIL